MEESTVSKLIAAEQYRLDETEDELLLRSGQVAFFGVKVLAAISFLGFFIWFGFDYDQNAPSLVDQLSKRIANPLEKISGESAAWGQFGDFLGGLLNPIIGLVTVYLILINVRMQKKELRNSLIEMRNSNNALARQNKSNEFQDFQNTFFTWLNSYRAIVASIAYPNSSPPTSGVAALKDAMTNAFESTHVPTPFFNFKKDREVRLTQADVNAEFQRTAAVPEGTEKTMFDRIMTTWDMLYKLQSHNIGSMFRTGYRLIRWVDEQPSSVLSINQKMHYIGIVRAQISDIEMKYLFYNGFTERGRKFNNLINRYALFDNLDIDSDPMLRFMADRESSPFLPHAYSSDEARELLFGMDRLGLVKKKSYQNFRPEAGDESGY